MSFLDIFKKNNVSLHTKKGKGFDNWHAETDVDKFAGIDQSDVENYLSRITDGIYDFLVVTLKEPVQNAKLIHIRKDSDPGTVSMEISVLNEENGKSKLYSRFGLKKENALAMLVNIANKGVLPDFSDWADVGEFGDPRELWFKNNKKK